MVWIIIMLITLLLIGSIVQFIRIRHERRQHFSMELFYTLTVVYIVVMIGFGLVYFVLASEGMVILRDEWLQVDSIVDRLAHAIYFSGVTLMTVGYGDITPIGVGRIIALIEALIGCVLPAAFFVQLFHRK
ncbi:potassium channel family protein [Pontibacillus litoralis]|uniref:LCTB protein n=1 Tax=Pontibacillus litoralis JSM 072002 TaxID=1385512 RepID=A0A0A5HWV6_9BACI|nr:potassium channel family protein [Pontibacillus litoralis]KGX88112.1 LCTB protein [Pontibacillus litoralis JSM 072002]